VVVAREGTVWRADPPSAVALPLSEVGHALHAVAVAHEAPHAVVVGDAGAMSWSVDGGVSWSRVDLGTTADLHAVALAHDGSAAIAVGDGGTVVRIAEDGASVTRPTSADLRDVHLDGDGRGAAVGIGAVVTTTDAGLGFAPLPGIAADLLGVDALGPDHW
jgi:photosystem II stability/assembly factor-like uncharacterized protein